jgi:hypothetical protein
LGIAALVALGLGASLAWTAAPRGAGEAPTGQPNGAVSTRREVIATVGGVDVTRQQFESYAGAFIDPDGKLTVDRNLILDAVINQSIASQEASRRGISVSEADTDKLVGEWETLALPPAALARSGGMEAVRERSWNFLIFKAVKEAVLNVSVSDQEIRVVQAGDPVLAKLPFDDVAEHIRMRLVRERTEEQWNEWLRTQRSCTDITILDDGFARPSTTRSPKCG